MVSDDRKNDQMLTQLLLEWIAAPESERAAIEQRIRDVFEETRAIFVLDMSEFSSSVIKRGILHFLARIHEMRSVVLPAVRRNGGEVVKFIGDDVVAIFDRVEDALVTSREIRDWTRCHPPSASRDVGFRVAIGIGYGPLLHVPHHDIWGNEVNLAFKLGEDIAGADEILLTASAYAQLPETLQRLPRIDFQVSGVAIEAYQDLFPG